ncbi:MAG: hypothetical protein ACOYW7_08635 [Nitrospirota bacterium]
MKGMRRVKILVLALVALMISAGSLYAEEPKVTGYGSVDVMSNYVWRGQKLSNSWVVQPSLGITYGSFGANIWANYDSDKVELKSDGTTTEEEHGEVTETDFTLSYTKSFGKLTLGGGYIYYAFDGGNDTQEVYVSASYDTLLKPTIAVYYDYDEGDGAFVIASIGHSFPISKMTLNLGASASYNIRNEVMGFDEDGDEFSDFYNGEVSASLNIPVYKSLVITPKIAYSFALSDDAEAAISRISNDNRRDIVYGGINLTLSF